MNSSQEERRVRNYPKSQRQRTFESAEAKANQLKNSSFFKDSSKRIDFVLVTTTDICANIVNNKKIQKYLESLVSIGAQIEIDFGRTYEEYFFIKIHLPDAMIDHLANLYYVELSCENPNYSGRKKPKLKFLETELHKFEDSKMISRAPDSISGVRPAKATNAERAMLLHRLMNEISYGPEPNEFGLSSMQYQGLFIASYTLHEGSYKWTKTGPLSDRQLLARFWANFNMLFKAQPLNLIEKYFGTEVGIYFAWLEYYIIFLIPAALVGVICFVVGAVNTYITDEELVTNEICKSKIIMCPYCEHYSLCPFTPLKHDCSYSRLGFLLDNPATIFFSMFMSVWATVFMIMWRRRLNSLRLEWNVFKISVGETVRHEYIQKATGRRISKVTGELEPYIPNLWHCSHFALTNATMLFIALVIFSVALSVIVYQFKMRYIASISKDLTASRKAAWIASITGSLFIGLSITVFTALYEKIAYWLTVKECPRTQQSFDKAFIWKNCILNFSNNYAAITYLAFFKGKFFTHPGASYQWNILGGITTDLCGPGGCLADVGIQLATVLIVPSFFSCLFQAIYPCAALKFKHYWNIYYREKIPQWELDFYLENTYKYYMFNEYRDLLIQYGYITCFVCALPLAPLFALIRNIFEVRIDAKKFLKYQKRHIACKVDGLGAYSDILNWITYVSVMTNACVIAFSSNFVPRTIYRIYVDPDLRGYVNSTLSVFNTSDYEKIPSGNVTTNITICYYHGKRYPPNHPQKYALTDDYFYQLVGQLAFVLVFEHVIVLIKAVLVTFIRSVPRYVTDKLRMQEHIAKLERTEKLNELYKKEHGQLFSKDVHLPKKLD